MNVRGFAAAAVFLAGCAVGGVSSQLVVPKASAQQAATLTKWENRCVVQPWDDMNAVGARFGAEGWEILAANGLGDGTILLCFKRPKL
ncbi:MAG TPA: hypothetical protein VHP33_10985 [Polyangiaceae bacterium]|nr:hypothetical protein [Polyangiaceae bacterium]